MISQKYQLDAISDLKTDEAFGAGVLPKNVHRKSIQNISVSHQLA